LIWWKNEFKDDFYIEVMRHNQEDENRVNASLISLRENDVKIIATNNTFYIDKENSNAHDIFYCVCVMAKTNYTYRSWPRLSLRIAQSRILFQVGRRDETAFANLPEAISNISEIVDKIEIFDLARECTSKFEIG
jgi:DNA polymerase-3 subunit alpha